jgi:hypothetical protein
MRLSCWPIRDRGLGRLACLASLVVALLGAATARAEGPKAVCPAATAETAQCMSFEITGAVSFEAGGEKGGLDPENLRSAYKLPESGGSGQTVAIVDAYNDPDAESNLKTYRSHYGLPECTTTNGCFKKVNQKGETTSYPENNSSWSSEISLDLDMVSAVCSECHILLIEANSSLLTDLEAAENEAATLKVTEISDSWDALEHSSETSENSAFEHSGIPIVVASGDNCYINECEGGSTPNFPAVAPSVIAVGGTELTKTATGRGWSESTWYEEHREIGTGSGCSLYESKPSWETGSACSKRTDNDVSAVAACKTPLSIYDSYEREGWWLECGTSASAPIVAGIEALSSPEARKKGPELFWEIGAHGGLFDVTEGSNYSVLDGSCKSYLCEAEIGYDGPTGNGTPHGAFMAPKIAEETSPATVINPSNSEQWVIYVNPEHEIAYWRNGTPTDGWGNGVIGGSVKGGTSPTALINSSGDVSVYYVNTSGEIASWTLSEGKWVARTLGGKVASNSNPCAVTNPSTNYQYVVYVNSSNEIADFIYNGSSWTGPSTVGGKVKSDTSPTATVWSSGNLFMYYVNTSGEIANWSRSATGELSGRAFGGKVASESSPYVVTNPSTNWQYVVYVNSNNEIADFIYDGEWTGPSTMGGKVKSGTNPTISVWSSNNAFVFYVNTSGEIANWSRSATGELSGRTFGGEVMAHSSPVSGQYGSSQLFVFYASGHQEANQFVYDTEWSGPDALPDR